MTTVNITVTNDADFYRTFQYITVGGTPIDITDCAFEMKLRRHAADKAVVLRLGSDTGEIVVVDAINGIFTVKIPQDELERLGLGDYDHSNIMTNIIGKTKVWEGLLTNNAGPTR
jgi:hypothetical protein